MIKVVNPKNKDKKDCPLIEKWIILYPGLKAISIFNLTEAQSFN